MRNYPSEGFRAACEVGSVTTDYDIEVFGAGESGGNLHIKNRFIVGESMKLTQAICDEPKLMFGGCIANSFEIEISKNVDLTGKYITVHATQTALMPTLPGAHLYPGAQVYPGHTAYTWSGDIFSGEVYSCKRVKNSLSRQIIAYDRFYWRGEKNAREAYKSVFVNGTSTSTLGALRLKLLKKFGIRQQDIVDETPSGGSYDWNEPVPLPADNFVIHKISGYDPTFGELMRMIAEFNGVFLWLNGSGNLEYITLGSETPESYTYYIDSDCEPFAVPEYDSIDTHSAGIYNLVAESPQNVPYDLVNELVTAGYVATGTGDVFQDAFDEVKDGIVPNFRKSYRPISLKADARLWLYPGDRISFSIKWYTLKEETEEDPETATEHEKTVTSYVLSRTITGVQALTDEIEAQGECIAIKPEEESQ